MKGEEGRVKKDVKEGKLTADQAAELKGDITTMKEDAKALKQKNGGKLSKEDRKALKAKVKAEREKIKTMEKK